MTLGFLFCYKNFCKLLLCFLRSFCSARIRLDPLGGQVMHHDFTSMIVSRFTTFTENFVICCNQITPILCTRYDSANGSSAPGPLWFLFLLEISQFRSFGKRVSTLCLPGSLLADLGSKVIDERNWRESLHSGTLSYTRFCWTLAAIPVCLDDTVSSVFV